MATVFSNPRGPKPNQPLGASENIQNAVGQGMLIPWDSGAKIVRGPLFTRIAAVISTVAILATAPVNLLANTLGAAAPAAKPFSQTEFPNPAVKPFPVSLRTHIGDGIRTVAATPFRQNEWQNPRSAASRAITNVFPRVSTTPPAVSAPPFCQTEWPNPVLRKQDIRTHVNDGIRTVAVAAPSRQSDWPNPQVKAGPIENRSFIDGSEFWMLRDQFYGLAGKPNFDFPNPQRAKQNPQEQSQNLLQSTLRPATGTPFSQGDWQNPARRPRQPLGNFYHRIATATGQAPAGTPFYQTEFPNPRGRLNTVARISQPATNVATMVESFIAMSGMQDVPAKLDRVALISQPQGGKPQFMSVAAAGNPFRQTEWPNPLPRRFISSSLSWLDAGNSLRSATPGTKPFSQADFPNPRRAPSRAITNVFPRVSSTPPAQAASPFAQTDWPNPKGAVSRAIGNIYPRVSETPPAQPSGTPFAQTEWPNPRGPKRNPQDWSYKLVPIILVQPGTPTSQHDWPNPLRRVDPTIVELSVSANTEAVVVDETLGQAALEEVPQRFPRVAIESQQNQGRNTAALTAPQPKPFAQYDWPNPRGAKPVVDLKTWRDPLKVLAGKDTFFGVAGHPNYDFPNPRGRRFAAISNSFPRTVIDTSGQQQPPPSGFRKIITVHHRENHITTILG